METVRSVAAILHKSHPDLGSHLLLSQLCLESNKGLSIMGICIGTACQQSCTHHPLQQMDTWNPCCNAAWTQGLRIIQPDSVFPSEKVELMIYVTETIVRWLVLCASAIAIVTEVPESTTFLQDDIASSSCVFILSKDNIWIFPFWRVVFPVIICLYNLMMSLHTLLLIG